MSNRNDPTAYVDGMRVVQPYTPRPLTAEGALLQAKEAQRRQWGVIRVLLIVALLILFASIVANLADKDPKTFASFLEMLQTAPSIGTEWLSFESVSLSLPDWLEWLAPFIVFLEGVIRVGGFLITGIVQALTFVLHFLTWVFV